MMVRILLMTAMGFEVVVLNLAIHLPRALGTNYPEIPDGCLPREFTLGVDVLQMLVDGAGVLLEKLADERLCQPDGFILKPALDARLPVLRLVEDQRGWAGGFVGYFSKPVRMNL